jgi:hypothetical protein
LESSIELVVLCAASALVAAPLAALATSTAIKCAYAKKDHVPAWASVCSLFVALIVCAGVATPVLQAWLAVGTSEQQVYELGVGQCTSLSAYPTQITASTSTSVAFVYTATDSDSNGYPIYTRDATSTFPPAQLYYSSVDERWIMADPSDANIAVLYNNLQSSVVYQDQTSASDAQPTLHAVFQDSALSFDSTIVVCGTFEDESSCMSSSVDD